MKKTIVIIILLISAFVADAQIKVAILEPVDKAQNVNYGVKLLLRSSLTAAISNTPGYEGYDRVDMASIAGEHDFQRTGNVSDNQIKQLGMATGAAFVLVTEAAKYDVSSIIITAKILDVETFGIKNSAVVVSGTSANEMQESCTQLSAQLLGVKSATSPRTTQTSLQSTSAAQQPSTQTSEKSSDFVEFNLSDGQKLYVYQSPTPAGLNPAIFGHTQSEANYFCSCIGEGWRLPTTREILSMYTSVKSNRIRQMELATVNVYLNIQGRWNWVQEEGVRVSFDKIRQGKDSSNKKNAFFCVKEMGE